MLPVLANIVTLMAFEPQKPSCTAIVGQCWNILVAPPFGFMGSEDCLFMDITVPGGINPQANRAVMIWIHGGGMTSGTGSDFYGAPLALYGDVIVVTINYRLGIMGFLYDGDGSYTMPICIPLFLLI